MSCEDPEEDRYMEPEEQQAWPTGALVIGADGRRHSLRLFDEWGERVRCRHCGGVFDFPMQAAAADCTPAVREND